MSVRIGNFGYQSSNVVKSVTASGQVYHDVEFTRRSNKKVFSCGLDQIQVDKEVLDARFADKMPTFEGNGYFLGNCKFGNYDYANDHSSILNLYYKELEQYLLSSIPGIKKAIAFNHYVRSPQHEHNSNLAIMWVHNDYTLMSAPRHFEFLSNPPMERSTWADIDGVNNQPLISKSEYEHYSSGKGRYMIINVWRSFGEEPVKHAPLAFIDPSSLDDADLATCEYRTTPVEASSEVYMVGNNEKHKWSFISDVTRDEPLVIKQWDSHGDFAVRHAHLIHPKSVADTIAQSAQVTRQQVQEQVGADFSGVKTFCAHSAFEDATMPADYPARRSLEVRVMALF